MGMGLSRRMGGYVGGWMAKKGVWVTKVGERAGKLRGWVDKLWKWVAKQENGWISY
jgi:hypothetical protein